MPARMTRVERWERKLGRLFPHVHKRVGKVLAQEAEAMAEAIHRAAPVDEGHLRGSVDYNEVKGSGVLAWRVVAGDEVAFYARMLEFGTPRQARQAFFFPTYRARRTRVRRRLASAVRKGIKEGLAAG